MNKLAYVTIPLAMLLIACGGKSIPSDGKPVAGIPTDSTEMFTFLQSGTYKDWNAESKVHESEGPHGQVRTFVNAALVASMTADKDEHPVGGASVKELYDEDGTTLTGWAVMLKVAPGTSDKTWYWYEVFSTTNGSKPIQGIAHSTCTDCHSSGTDYVITSVPFE